MTEENQKDFIDKVFQDMMNKTWNSGILKEI